SDPGRTTFAEAPEYRRRVPRAATLIDRVKHLPPLAVDAAIAAAVGLVTIVSVLVDDRNDPGVSLTAAGVALLLAQCVPLVWRRRAPLAVMLAVVAAGVAYGIAELPDPAVLFGPTLAVYTLAAHCPRSVTVPWGIAGVVVGALALAVSRDADAADVAVNYFVFVTAWVGGDTVRGQRERGALRDAQREGARRRAREGAHRPRPPRRGRAPPERDRGPGRGRPGGARRPARTGRPGDGHRRRPRPQRARRAA